jgi:urease beta subunit
MTNVLLSFYHLHTQNKIISKKTNKIKGYILIIPSVKSYKYDPQYQTEGENEKK